MGMLCADHPYRSNPGGVCAFCLQEKLGKLVSSSKSTHFLPLQHPPSSSSSSPSPASSRSDLGHDAAAVEKKKRWRKLGAGGTAHAAGSVAVGKNGGGLGLKRSKSVAPRRIGSSLAQVGDGGGRSNGETAAAVADNLRKKSFWSFLYHSSVSSASTSSSAANGNVNRRRSTSSSSGGVCDGDPSHSAVRYGWRTGRGASRRSNAQRTRRPSNIGGPPGPAHCQRLSLPD
ncbi:uncharacterized protein LOC141845346 [Curcuma longa]|uniref:uncharacterized protein LOC141845346 n=1 Tax=Curcuma longa TaxID=136217 RepID=UPI003D9DFCC3